jgi:hypothetical protein
MTGRILNRVTGAAAVAIWLAGFEVLVAQIATWVETTPPTSPAFAHHDMTSKP